MSGMRRRGAGSREREKENRGRDQKDRDEAARGQRFAEAGRTGPVVDAGLSGVDRTGGLDSGRRFAGARLKASLG